MRIIGIDLAVRSVHKAVVADESGHYLTRVIEFHTDVRDLAQLLGAARQGDPSGSTVWRYDPRGRVVEETKTVTGVDFFSSE